MGGYIGVALLAAAVFGLCFFLDKGYEKLFRGKAQHKSGRSVRPSKRYGSMGFALAVIGLGALITAGVGNLALMIGGGLLLVLGIGLVAYYLGSGIYYDENSFLVESFGRKRRSYDYGQILHQQLYLMQGGSTIVELHMDDGTAVQVVSNMIDYGKFLDFAFLQYCARKGMDPENCEFHDSKNSRWFPEKEETECIFPQ